MGNCRLKRSAMEVGFDGTHGEGYDQLTAILSAESHPEPSGTGRLCCFVIEESSSLRHEGAPFEERSHYSDPDAAVMMALIEELFPICRSITGDGARQTLKILGRYLPIELNEVPSGTPVLDWTVPREWNIRGAYIARQDGSRIVDFAANNLHVVQY